MTSHRHGGAVSERVAGSVGTLLRQRLAREQFEEVCEVVARVEGDPRDVVAQHNPRAHQQLCKVHRVDAALLVLLKIDPRPREQIDGILCVHIITAKRRRELRANCGIIARGGVVAAGTHAP